MKTPPPPKWGDPIEEDFYDPNEDFFNADKARYEMEKRKLIALKSIKERSSERSSLPTLPPTGQSKIGSKRLKLKRKVIYTYEYSSDDEPTSANARTSHQTTGLPTGQMTGQANDHQKEQHISRQLSQLALRSSNTKAQ